MKHVKTIRPILALTLVLMILAGTFGTAGIPAARAASALPAEGPLLAAAVGFPRPAENVTPIGDSADALPDGTDWPSTVIEVRTVDEFLDAIGPDRVIRLADGEYNLTRAGSYGRPVGNGCWYWEDGYDGFQLRIFGLSGLYLMGSGPDRCSIVAEPRYANVIGFSDCENLGLAGLNIGHTPGQGYCSGGVLDFNSCTGVLISACDLYGCGTLGISAAYCRNLSAVNTVIRDCTYGAIEAYSCDDFRFVSGLIQNCGISKDPDMADGWTGFNLIHADSGSFFAVVNSEIRSNVVQTLFSSNNTRGFYILGCEVGGNTVGYHDEGYNSGYYSYSTGSVFSVQGRAIRLQGTSFTGNDVKTGFFGADGNAAPGPVSDLAGLALDRADIESMGREVCTEEVLETLALESTAYAPAPGSNESPAPYGSSFREVHVTTADEFLAAIGNYTIIHVDTDLLDLSTASNYGSYSGEYYYWADNYDGPGLVIADVYGLYIIGEGKDRTVIEAVPRYSDVLRFDSCYDLYLCDLTAGHRREEPGSCSGDVLEFFSCSQVTISNCGLFGCGVLAVNAEQCSGFNIYDTEMYDCSWEGVQLYSCDNFTFERCTVHDCESNSVYLSDSRRILWNWSELFNGRNMV